MILALFTYPDWLKGEFEFINSLFDAGLELLHLRKPECSEDAMVLAIQSINKEYRNRVVIHSHLHLAEKFNLKGIHFTSSGRCEWGRFVNYKGSKSTSLHSEDELEEQSDRYNYVFISPVFPSISKLGYEGDLDLERIHQHLSKSSKRSAVFALGGVELSTLSKLKTLKFDGVGVLGRIWKPFIEGDYSIINFQNLLNTCHD